MAIWTFDHLPNTAPARQQTSSFKLDDGRRIDNAFLRQLDLQAHSQGQCKCDLRHHIKEEGS